MRISEKRQQMLSKILSRISNPNWVTFKYTNYLTEIGIEWAISMNQILENWWLRILGIMIVLFAITTIITFIDWNENLINQKYDIDSINSDISKIRVDIHQIKINDSRDQEAVSNELSNLETRVEKLDIRIKKLEDNQKSNGEQMPVPPIIPQSYGIWLQCARIFEITKYDIW